MVISARKTADCFRKIMVRSFVDGLGEIHGNPIFGQEWGREYLPFLLAPARQLQIVFEFPVGFFVCKFHWVTTKYYPDKLVQKAGIELGSPNEVTYLYFRKHRFVILEFHIFLHHLETRISEFSSFRSSPRPDSTRTRITRFTSSFL